MQLAAEPKESLIVEGSAQGTDLLTGATGQAVRDKLLEFLQRQ
jgi:hypothetical protein